MFPQRLFGFIILCTVLIPPLHASAAQPSVSSSASWINELEAPSVYTHVRDGNAASLSLEAYLNRYRERVGVPRLRTSAALQASAQAHAEYLAQNGQGNDPHAETTGLSGFTGRTIQARCTAAGYTQTCTEIQAGGSSADDGYSAIDALMMTPYHRLSMVYPFFSEIGCAMESGWFVCDIGFAMDDYGNEYNEETSAIMYPYHGQATSTTFYVSENPMPYPSLAGTFIGPTIMYWPLGKEITEATVGLFDLTTEEAISSLVRLDFDDRYAQGALFFNPTEPLELNHEYAVHVEGETSDGEAFSETWTFKTQQSSRVDFPNVDQEIVYDAGVRWNGGAESLITTPNTEVETLIDRLAGRIMLAVDRHGEAYYIDPITRARYYLRNGDIA